MTLELNDEVAVPRFEDSLSRELARIHEQEQADARHLQGSRWRQPGRRSVLAGIGTMAAAAALIAATLAIGSGGDSDESDLEARIISATSTAAANSIVHETTNWSENPAPVDIETWRDEATLTVRMVTYAADGSVLSDWGQIDLTAPAPPGELPPGTRLIRTVDYCLQEYTVEEMSLYAQDDVDMSVLSPIVNGLTEGWMHLDGTEEVDGRELIRVFEDAAPSLIYLVDPETYVPVMVKGEDGEGNDRAFLTNYEYLPRTPENLAQLRTADPPEGFEQVDQLDQEVDSSSCI